ncbi:hypothetical protein PIB30_008530 [Stylosanthes scabra]|uniref:Uncharacterized protein n=1 Tax=Stylosanthes scabra TaxID=79078 RepID=A0ABU6Z4M6_9FABA|nr:hypothetical protein [Stylosanthes scabra]
MFSYTHHLFCAKSALGWSPSSFHHKPLCYYTNTFSSSSSPSLSLSLFFGEASSIVIPIRTLTFPSSFENSLYFDLFEDTFEYVADLFVSQLSVTIALRRVKHRIETEFFLQNLSDRVFFLRPPISPPRHHCPAIASSSSDGGD